MPEKQILKILGSQFMKEKKNQDTKVVNGEEGEPLVGQQKSLTLRTVGYSIWSLQPLIPSVERCP